MKALFLSLVMAAMLVACTGNKQSAPAETVAVDTVAAVVAVDTTAVAAPDSVVVADTTVQQ